MNCYKIITLRRLWNTMKLSMLKACSLFQWFPSQNLQCLLLFVAPPHPPFNCFPPLPSKKGDGNVWAISHCSVFPWKISKGQHWIILYIITHFHYLHVAISTMHFGKDEVGFTIISPEGVPSSCLIVTRTFHEHMEGFWWQGSLIRQVRIWLERKKASAVEVGLISLSTLTVTPLTNSNGLVHIAC